MSQEFDFAHLIIPQRSRKHLVFGREWPSVSMFDFSGSYDMRFRKMLHAIT